MAQTTEQKYSFENPFKTDPLLRRAFPFIKDRKKALDIGCGEGADSVFLAKKGFLVQAIDNDKTALTRFKAYRYDHKLSDIRIQKHDVVRFPYKESAFDVINCLLLICCMRKSDFRKLLQPMKRALKPGGIIILSSRNYLDPKLKEYHATEKMIEPNTFIKKDDCCRIAYFVEKNELKNAFKDLEILYHFEGMVPCKHKKHGDHGETHIICRRPKKYFN